MIQPRMSVIIPTYRDWNTLAVCLDALRKQSVAPEKFEIVVANNDPSMLVPSEFELPSNGIMINVDQPGSYAARNAAVKVSRADLLAFTDSDCVPERNWLASALKLFDDNPNVLRIAGEVRFFVEDGNWSAAALYDRTFTLQQKRFSKEGKAATANAFSRRTVFDAVGLFDPKLLTGGDHEWSQRAQIAGFTLAYCSEAVVGHPARSSLVEIIRKTRRFAGGTIARKRERGDKIILPHFDNILPPFRRALLLFRSNDLTTWEALRVWMVLYLTRLIFVAEQVRLVTYGGQYERR